MRRPLVENSAGDRRLARLIEQYWEQDARGRWVHSVDSLAKKRGTTLHHFYGMVAAHSYACSPDWRCEECGKAVRATSRKQWDERASRCSACRDLKKFRRPGEPGWLDALRARVGDSQWDINNFQVLIPRTRTSRQVAVRLDDTGLLCLMSGGHDVILAPDEQDKLLLLLLSRPEFQHI